MRARLSEQLNKILQTRDSARGLIVSMSDVLFDTGKYSLKPGAREKLAKVAGILLAYPGLNIEVGGYTDNVGGDAMNQTLSENRAGSVRDYLVEQGVATNSVSAKGFGNTLPVATNDNSAAVSRTGEWNFSSPAKPSATRSTRQQEACARASVFVLGCSLDRDCTFHKHIIQGAKHVGNYFDRDFGVSTLRRPPTVVA